VEKVENLIEQVKQDMDALGSEWIESDYLNKGDLFVVGCSTSEIAGKSIGTSGSEELAEQIFHSLKKLSDETGVRLVFQCCEHLNRALVMERDTMTTHQLEEVTVIPSRTAGGSMASYAYKHFKNAVVVENVNAHAGIDIGETMIGMQLKQVAVPLRFKQKSIGNAHLNGARTRPKLIGGERAVYKN